MELSDIASAVPKENACMFTGHRDLVNVDKDDLSLRVKEEIVRQYGRGITTFFAGGAIGFDMLASVTLLNLKNALPDLRLILALPHFRHYERWSRSDKAIFAEILRRANGVIYMEKEYTPGCMHRRNRFMVDHAGTCICYLTKETGGAAFTVREAKKQGLTVVNLARPTTEQTGFDL